MISEDIINMFKHSLKSPKEPSAQWSPKLAVGAVLQFLADVRTTVRDAVCLRGVRGLGFRRVKRQFCVQILSALKEPEA